jgi:large subunit ribosomal protein L4
MSIKSKIIIKINPYVNFYKAIKDRYIHNFNDLYNCTKNYEIDSKIYSSSVISNIKKSFQYRVGLIHKNYLSYLKTSRNYTASTKTKAEVSGGGRKPWKQKGTGQARAGSIRSPLWVGGGIIFGPKPRVVFKKINKQEKNLALKYALTLKAESFFSFLSYELFNFKSFFSKNKPKTQDIIQILLEQKIDLKSHTLFILDNPKKSLLVKLYNKKFWIAARNLKNVTVATLDSINLDQIIKADKALVMCTNILDLKKLTFSKKLLVHETNFLTKLRVKLRNKFN